MQALQSTPPAPIVRRTDVAPMSRPTQPTFAPPDRVSVSSFAPLPCEIPVFTMPRPILPGGGLAALVATAFLRS